MVRAVNLDGFADVFEPEPLTEDALDEFYSNDTMPVRMDNAYQNPFNELFKSCLKPKTQNAHLLLGHKGCGKSTELVVLKKRFEDEGSKVSIIDCKMETDFPNLEYWDLLILMSKHLCKIAKEINCELPKYLVDSMESFWKETSVVETLSNSRNISAEVNASFKTPNLFKILNILASLSAELRHGYDKRTEIREKLRKNTLQWVSYMQEISKLIFDKIGYRPILIYENLDKLDDYPANMTWEIFSNPLSQMPFPIIYTFPISLSYSPRFAGVEASFNYHCHILPMIEVRKLNRTENINGIEIIKEIVKKRADLSLFDNAALIHLIKKTGGSIRDLFHCIIEAASIAEQRNPSKIDLYDVELATKKLRSSLTRRIETKNYPLLKQIYNGAKFKKEIDDKEMLLEMLRGLIVYEYNGERWHDLHPLIEDFLIDQGEIQPI
jgi:energy-coupling factor transporter ATP-binding protein EcfA2